MPAAHDDWVLDAMLEGISATKSQVELTVFCGGLAVTGTAVAEEVYFERIGMSAFANQLSRIQEQNQQSISEISARLGREGLSAAEREAMLSKMNELRSKFIVMVDVTILGAGPAPLKVPAWRGRLSQISGWVLGALDVPS